MASRNLNDLHPDLAPIAQQFIVACQMDGIDLLVTCTYRSNQEQDQTWAQGRTLPGRIVTKARGGESKHNAVDAEGHPCSEALDVVPLRHGKCVWDETDPVWPRIGAIGRAHGLAWAGDWKGDLVEFPHFQMKREP